MLRSEAADPKTKALIEHTIENKFQCLFLCHGTCTVGFTYCCPLLDLNETHLKSKYKGILLAATATDANGQLFPLTYAIVSIENDNSLWFLRLLREVVEVNAPVFLTSGNQDESLVFLFDRQKGLLEDVERVFPNSPHGFCMKHLEEIFTNNSRTWSLKSYCRKLQELSLKKNLKKHLKI